VYVDGIDAEGSIAPVDGSMIKPADDEKLPPVVPVSVGRKLLERKCKMELHRK
jgi:hypothetical protein